MMITGSRCDPNRQGRCCTNVGDDEPNTSCFTVMATLSTSLRVTATAAAVLPAVLDVDVDVDMDMEVEVEVGG